MKIGRSSISLEIYMAVTTVDTASDVRMIAILLNVIGDDAVEV